MKKNRVRPKYLAGVALAMVVGLPFTEVKAEENSAEPTKNESTTFNMPTLIIEDEVSSSEDVVVLDTTPTEPSLEDVVITEPSNGAGDFVVLDTTPTKPSLEDVVITEPSNGAGDVVVPDTTPTEPSLEGVVITEPSNGAGDLVVLDTTPTKPSLEDVVITEPSNGGDKDNGTQTETGSKENETKPTETTVITPPIQPGRRPTVTRPTVDGGTETVEDPTKTEVNQQGGSQVGSYSEVIGQIVSEVSEEKPVQTASGHTIVSTDNSNVVIAHADGTRVTVSAQTVGGRVNPDGTISVKNSKGKLETLPKAGDKVNRISILGLFLLLFAFQVARPSAPLKKIY